MSMGPKGTLPIALDSPQKPFLGLVYVLCALGAKPPVRTTILIMTAAKGVCLSAFAFSCL